MELEINGKVGLVTGAGGGLGGAIALALAMEGVRVAIADVDEDGLARSADRIARAGGTALPFLWDLADLAVVDQRLSDIRQKLGGIDILVNNAGGPPPASSLEIPLATWEAHFRSMVLSIVSLTSKVVPDMRSRKWGRVITSTSSGIIAPIPDLALSNSLRLALVGWSKTLSSEVAADGVTVNVIVPGRIATSRIQQLDAARAQREGRSVEHVRASSVASIPLRRYGRPEEYGAAVTFLASGAASYITGSVLRVDGGLLSSI
jgi:3-oxoacyl-[acyl-carrier protein] reductase